MKEDKEDIVALANSLKWKVGEDFHDALAESVYTDASAIASEVVKEGDEKRNETIDAKIDKIVTSRTWGFPLMILILSVILSAPL